MNIFSSFFPQWRVNSEEVISEIPQGFLVGPSGLEPPTSCLSGTRSNLLSYEPMWLVYSFTLELVEMMGFEPMTPCLQGRCSPSWATPPLFYEVCFSSPFLDFKESRYYSALPSVNVSTELSSRTVSRKVLSPLQSLTSVFGMGTGGPSAFVALTILQ